MNTTIETTKSISINAIMAYDHAGMIERLQDKLGLSQTEASDLFDDMKRFLYLCATTPDSIAPSGPIDEAWHHFILHTADYQAFCRRYLGKFVHHNPHTREQRMTSDNSAFLRMRAAAIAAFGASLSQNWGFDVSGAADCKNTESCNNGCKDCSPVPSCEN